MGCSEPHQCSRADYRLLRGDFGHWPPASADHFHDLPKPPGLQVTVRAQQQQRQPTIMVPAHTRTHVSNRMQVSKRMYTCLQCGVLDAKISRLARNGPDSIEHVWVAAICYRSSNLGVLELSFKRIGVPGMKECTHSSGCVCGTHVNQRPPCNAQRFNVRRTVRRRSTSYYVL